MTWSRHSLRTEPISLSAYPFCQGERGDETIEVPVSGPLTFTDPKTMLEECLAGTGIAQVIGWGFGQLLERGKLVDLFPNWHGERFPLFAFHPSRAHPPAKVRAFIDFCIEAAREI